MNINILLRLITSIIACRIFQDHTLFRNNNAIVQKYLMHIL